MRLIRIIHKWFIIAVVVIVCISSAGCDQQKKDSYDAAVLLLENGFYEQAAEAFGELGDYKDSEEKKLQAQDKIFGSDYALAISLYMNKDYIHAIPYFLKFGNYRDSNNRAEECKKFILQSIGVGDSFILGAYEQDNDESNGKEPIEWIVLDKRESDLLLISRYAIDCQHYYTQQSGTTWRFSSLRAWLNDTFYNEAFCQEEQQIIRSTLIQNPDNYIYGVKGGSETTDKLFLLSIDEANQYFISDEARKCLLTDYAYSKGAYRSDDGICWWWLRTPGNTSFTAATVYDDGYIISEGRFVYGDKGKGYNAVRPAMWVTLSDDEQNNAGNKLQPVQQEPSPGDIYCFGTYEQDGNAENGKEPIEWIVLDKKGSSMFLISLYALDCQQYHTSNVGTWEMSSLREWLNRDFYNEAFSETEQKQIINTTVLNTEYTSSENGYDSSSGQYENFTQDKVFLLSIEEAKQYFSIDGERSCAGTPFCHTRETLANISAGRSWWWLRTPAPIMHLGIDSVLYSGYISTTGAFRTGYGEVRPVMWIEIS